MNCEDVDVVCLLSFLLARFVLDRYNEISIQSKVVLTSKQNRLIVVSIVYYYLIRMRLDICLHWRRMRDRAVLCLQAKLLLFVACSALEECQRTHNTITMISSREGGSRGSGIAGARKQRERVKSFSCSSP